LPESASSVLALGCCLFPSYRQREVAEGSQNEAYIIPCEISLQHNFKHFR